MAATAATATAGILLSFAVQGAAEVPSGWTQVARDSFTRSAAGWGSADVGGAWTVNAPKSSATTSGSTGVARLTSGQRFTASLNAVSAADVNISDTVTVSAASGATYDVLSGWSARQQTNGSAYAARVRVSSNGKATLGISRRTGSTSTWLTGAALPFTVRSGQALRGELQISGTSPVLIKTRVYLNGSATPAWQIQYSDSASARIQAKGSVGVWQYPQSASSAVTVLRDNVSVGALNSTVPAPAPTATAAPSPAPAPSTPTPVATGGRGTTVGSQSYPIPSGAVFVDGRNGNDSNSGTQGSPYRTVTAAVAKAPSGKTIVIRGGTYNESVVTTTKTFTFQNYPKETVWFDGSVPVSGWRKSGTTWVASGWRHAFGSSMGGSATFKQRFIGNNPMAADADQVFINGGPLTQVASASAVTAGKFAVNDAAGTITVGTDPTGKEVRASNLQQAFNVSGPRSVIQGIGVRRYATTYENKAAVKMGNIGGTIRHVAVVDNAMLGLSINNTGKVVDHVVVSKNGMMGIGGNQTDNLSIKNSVVSDNNTQNFKDAPVSGGIKLTASRVSKIANNLITGNLSAGIWYDVSSYKMTVVNNEVRNNRTTQIQVEVSGSAIVANNIAEGGQIGILVFDSQDVKVFNNRLNQNSMFNIKLAQSERRQASGNAPEAMDKRTVGPDPNITFLVKNVQVSNNVFGTGSLYQFWAMDGRTNIPADRMNITINGNLFNLRVNKVGPAMVAWGKGDNVSQERYDTVAALAAAKNTSWRNAQVTTANKPLSSMGGDISAAASIAVGLPSDVASAAGLTAGAKKVGIF